MQISQLDPINVDSIATHKDNADKEVLIIMKKVETDKGKPKAYIAWDIIPQKDNKSSKVEAFSSQDKLNYLPNEFYVGDTLKNLDNYEVVESAFCFHYKINAVTGSKRGWSDLATNVNWIAIFDEGLLNAMRQRRFRTAFIFDVTVDGAGKPEIAAKNKEITDNPPKPGTVRVHNEKEKWQTVQPNMDTKDMAEDLHQVLMHAGRALNIPEHYLGSGGDVNRASASEMGLPTIKYMKRRQKYFKAILNQIIRVAIDVNIYATKGKLSASSKIDFTIEFPDIDTKDNLAIAQAVSQLVTSLVAAKDSGWISNKTAQRLMFKYLGEENTPEEEDKLIDTEKTDKEKDLKTNGDKGIVTKDYKNVDVKEALGV
ncbi:MAG: hypothetical protein M1308_24130 [Actinobacteria bacterium]|nr:hypothetical protein [Actinomycetota bacterium]